MTKFTTPEELFRPVSISGLKADDYRRITTGRLAETELAFLDEVFKASSAILNYLLRLMNEREYEKRAADDARAADHALRRVE
jgi:MoxR-like ATPase